MDNDNVFPFGSIQGGKEKTADEDGIPENDYTIVDIENQAFDVSGFMIFTPHHLAIMQNLDGDKGAVPAFLIPLERVKIAGLTELIEGEDEVVA